MSANLKDVIRRKTLLKFRAAVLRSRCAARSIKSFAALSAFPKSLYYFRNIFSSSKTVRRSIFFFCYGNAFFEL